MLFPMPLKHATETALILLLGIMMILAGVTCALLPPVETMVWPWVLAAAVFAAYPAAIFPLLKKRRAEYTLRMLHWAPLCLLVLWLCIDILAGPLPFFRTIERWYTAGWSIVPVCAALVLLFLYCLQVVRRRLKRGLLLGALTVWLVAGAAASQLLHWQTDMARFLWMQEGQYAHDTDWRAALRAGEGESEPVAVYATLEGAMWANLLSGSRPMTAPPPPHLPTSGSGFGMLALTLTACYCATMHRSAQRRILWRAV